MNLICIFAMITLSFSIFKVGISKMTNKSSFRHSLSSLSSHNSVTNPLITRNLLALDFDGVVCASALESSSTAVFASEKFWANIPTVSNNVEKFNCIVEGAMKLRPVIETGYEIMLLIRLLIEQVESNGKINHNDIFSTWSPTFRDKLLTNYNCNKVDLIRAFSDERDEMIRRDLSSWVSLNEIYSHVSEVFSSKLPSDSPFIIITTKQERYVRAILESKSLCCPKKEDIYDLENPYGSKAKVLEALISKSLLPSSSCSPLCIHFVEDRYETLLTIQHTPSLLPENVKLYLADWGYNTKEQIAEARSNPRITVIDGEDFKKLVRTLCV